MTKVPINLQELRRKIYVKAKAEKAWRFWGMYTHICKIETLQSSYEMVKKNNGAPGIDGVTFEDIEQGGRESFLEQIREELLQEVYLPLRNRKVEIPKAGGKTRALGIPSIRDRVVQGAAKLILEPIFEADFQPGSFGYRPRKTAHDAVHHARTALLLKLREIFIHRRSQTVEQIAKEINPILRGWINYFRIGQSTRCFSYVRIWVEKRVRRHLARVHKRYGMGWKRWTGKWIEETFGLYQDYAIRYYIPRYKRQQPAR